MTTLDTDPRLCRAVLLLDKRQRAIPRRSYSIGHTSTLSGTAVVRPINRPRHRCRSPGGRMSGVDLFGGMLFDEPLAAWCRTVWSVLGVGPRITSSISIAAGHSWDIHQQRRASTPAAMCRSTTPGLFEKTASTGDAFIDRISTALARCWWATLSRLVLDGLKQHRSGGTIEAPAIWYCAAAATTRSTPGISINRFFATAWIWRERRTASARSPARNQPHL